MSENMGMLVDGWRAFRIKDIVCIKLEKIDKEEMALNFWVKQTGQHVVVADRIPMIKLFNELIRHSGNQNIYTGKG
jgi:hypothetical protein